MRLTSLLSFLSILMLTTFASAAQQPPTIDSNRPKSNTSPPNILVIMADDLGYADLGCYGCKDIRTPRLDKLAAQGMRFTSAYVTGAMCGPSRAGFITGRHQSFFGYYENARHPLDPKQGFPKGIGTVASYIQDLGYATGGIGKWHMGTADHQHPNVLGYADWFGFLGGGLTYYPLDHPNYQGRYETLPRPWGVRDMHHTLPILKNSEPVNWKKYVTLELTDAGVEFISKERDEPFYLFMSYNAPHLELEAPRETIAQYSESSMTKVPGVTPHSRSVYAAMVDEMDQGIGRLLDTLDERSLTKNTVVIFLSDHGGMKRTSDNRPLRGAKGSVYEGGLRVPLIVRWPDHIKPGSVIDHPVTSLDLGATTYAMAGGDPSTKKLDGVDLTGLMTGQTDTAPHKMLFWHIGNSSRGIGVVRDGNYRLTISGKKTELYNLKEDIGETTNIAAANREKVQLMKAAWDEWSKFRKPPLWSAPKAASRFQYSGYPWLKGSPHYKSAIRTNIP